VCADAGSARRPTKGEYDVIWVQWVMGHLPDREATLFLQRCKAALRPGGFLCVKENNCQRGFVFDEEDGAITRSDDLYRELFEFAGLRVVRAELQRGFPDELLDVRMYALQ
jgi:protein N-terminal methyltransferase